MLGYWHKEELSREMLGRVICPAKESCVQMTGLKWMKRDFYIFLGRTDDIIKTRGEKVSPVEIENVIYKIPGIKEVAVIGIPDEIMGEAIIAFVTTHDQSRVDEKEILKECMTKLELFMVPQRIIFLDEMPKSSNSKIDKKELKKMYLENE